MQALNISRAEGRIKSRVAPLAEGWWLIPALALSIGLWALIFKLVF